MKIALISDIHGNLAAFRAVWGKIKNYPLILFAGDFTGYYPDINPIINQLKIHKVKSILGNHDRYLIAGRLPENIDPSVVAPFRENRRDIFPKSLDILKKLPPNERLEIDGLKIGLFHGSPFNDDEYIFPDSPLDRFQTLDFDLLIMGHTHWPMIKKANRMLIINPGSVGQPRDKDPRASFAIFDTKSKQARIQREKI